MEKAAGAKARNVERARRWRKENRKKCGCGNEMDYYSSACIRCAGHCKFTERQSMTLGEFRTRDTVKHPSWKDSQIREMARYLHADILDKPCAACGYSRHVELAHIIPLSKFPDDTTIAVANAKGNVIQLCRNCHWEFDNGMLDLRAISSSGLERGVSTSEAEGSNPSSPAILSSVVQ